MNLPLIDIGIAIEMSIMVCDSLTSGSALFSRRTFNVADSECLKNVVIVAANITVFPRNIVSEDVSSTNFVVFVARKSFNDCRRVALPPVTPVAKSTDHADVRWPGLPPAILMLRLMLEHTPK